MIRRQVPKGLLLLLYTYIHIYIYVRRVYRTISGSHTTTTVYARSAVRRRHKSSAQLTSGRNYGEWPCRKHPAAVAKALCALHRRWRRLRLPTVYYNIPTPTYLEYTYINILYCIHVVFFFIYIIVL
jgi:hypothetical protein